MKLLRDLTIEKYYSILVDTLFSYIACELENGNYNTAEKYKNIIPDWTLEDEIDVIKWIFRVSYFDQPDTLEELIKGDLTSKEDKSNNIPQIAHLLASFDVLHNHQKKIKPNDELDQLEKRGILILVEEGMPGPCLAYINAVKHSSLDDWLKLSLLHDVASNIVYDMDIFDSFLAKIVLKVTVQELTKLVSEIEQGSLKDKLLIDIEKYEGQIQQRVGVQKPTFIALSIIKLWKNLENNLGQTLDEDR